MPVINWTEWAGLIGFGSAAVAHLRAAQGGARGGRSARRWWHGLALAYALACIEVVAGTRHQLLRLLAFSSSLGELYAYRRPFQAGVLFVLVLLVGWITSRMIRSTRGGPVRLAAVIALWVACLFLAEVISLHQIDALMYQKLGPIMVIGWLWLALGLFAASVAVAARRRSLPRPVRRP